MPRYSHKKALEQMWSHWYQTALDKGEGDLERGIEWWQTERNMPDYYAERLRRMHDRVSSGEQKLDLNFDMAKYLLMPD